MGVPTRERGNQLIANVPSTITQIDLQEGFLVPTLPRGNAVFAALRRLPGITPRRANRSDAARPG
jgi:hypothetical protein